LLPISAETIFTAGVIVVAGPTDGNAKGLTLDQAASCSRVGLSRAVPRTGGPDAAVKETEAYLDR
jgi:hypothetical protein